MSTIITRSGKGSPLFNDEIDANFINLNTDKVEKDGSTPITGEQSFDSGLRLVGGTFVFDNANVTPAIVLGSGNSLTIGDVDNIISIPGLIEGDLLGDVQGNLTGDVTGNLNGTTIELDASGSGLSAIILSAIDPYIELSNTKSSTLKIGDIDDAIFVPGTITTQQTILSSASPISLSHATPTLVLSNGSANLTIGAPSNTITIPGTLAANISGNLTGDVTGNLNGTTIELDASGSGLSAIILSAIDPYIELSYAGSSTLKIGDVNDAIFVPGTITTQQTILSSASPISLSHETPTLVLSNGSANLTIGAPSNTITIPGTLAANISGSASSLSTSGAIRLSGNVIASPVGYTSGGAVVLNTTISNNAVTFAKIQNINTYKVLGRTTASAGVIEEINILDEDNLISNSSTSLATQQSIKAYVDANTGDSRNISSNETTTRALAQSDDNSVITVNGVMTLNINTGTITTPFICTVIPKNGTVTIISDGTVVVNGTTAVKTYKLDTNYKGVSIICDVNNELIIDGTYTDASI